MHNKRAGERRNYASTRAFPLMDNRGCIVPFDRSRVADRRLNSLKLEEIATGHARLQRMTS